MSRSASVDSFSYDVFVSAKSEDYKYARKASQFLRQAGLRVFFSEQELPEMGNSDYFKAIDDALECSCHMLLVTSSRDYVNSEWVQKEWRTYLNEKLSGRKTGNLVTLLCGTMTIGDLPISLRQHEARNVDDLPGLLNYFKAQDDTTKEKDVLPQIRQSTQVVRTRPDFQWHYFHPDFQKELIARISPNKGIGLLWLKSASSKAPSAQLSYESGEVVLGETTAEDVRPYLQSGTVKSIRCQAGQLCFSVDVNALIITAQDQLLTDSLRKMPSAQYPRANAIITLLKRLIVLNARPSREELEHEFLDHSMDVCLQAAILKRFYGDAVAGRSRLMPDNSNVSAVAKSLFVLFGDANASYGTLANPQFDSNGRADWIPIAKAWKEIFNDEESARSALMKKEALAIGTSDWISAASGWKEIFNDAEAACRCLTQAEKVADSSWEWKNMATSWKILLNDMNAARRCLVQAEAIAKTSDYAAIAWESVAEGWEEIFNDSQAACRCLEKAEASVEVVKKLPFSLPYNTVLSNWITVAAGWKKFLNDSEAARRCLAKAETVVKGAEDLTTLAAGWKSIFNDADAARRCLTKAETFAKGSSEWRSTAKSWKELFNDLGATRRCLTQAETVANSSFDLKYTAIDWKNFFDDSAAACRCLTKAETVANSSLDLEITAVGWKSALNDMEAARRCLTQAETVAKDADDWGLASEGWKNIFNDSDAVRRCLTKAETVAKSSLAWSNAAERWKCALNETEAARRCLTQAETVAEDSSDWRFIAKGWKDIFNDSGAAQRCLEKASALKLIKPSLFDDLFT